MLFYEFWTFGDVVAGHQAKAFGHFGIGVGQIAEVAAEDVFVEFLICFRVESILIIL